MGVELRILQCELVELGGVDGPTLGRRPVGGMRFNINSLSGLLCLL